MRKVGEGGSTINFPISMALVMIVTTVLNCHHSFETSASTIKSSIVCILNQTEDGEVYPPMIAEFRSGS